MNNFYQNLFKEVKGIKVFKEQNSDFYSNHWLSCITIDEQVLGKSREDIRLALEIENIETRPLWKPMHLQPIFENYPYYGTSVSENLFDVGLCLPSGSNLNDDDRLRISENINILF